MGMRRYTQWLRRRRRQPYKGVGGFSRRRTRRRIDPLPLRPNPEQLYRSKGTLVASRRRRVLNAGRGVQAQHMPKRQVRRAATYSALAQEPKLLKRLRARQRYYRKPRQRVVWYARRFGRLALRRRHHRRSKRLPRLLAQRLLLQANLPPLVALGRR
jgi:hypothetical protein